MAAAGDQHAASEVLRGISRHLNCLNEDNKATRKRALESIKKETVNKGIPSGVLQEVLSSVLKPLLKCMSDPIEKCRETTIAIITEFIRCVPTPEETLPYLMPCLAQRFGDKDILEPSEELRLSVMELLTLTVEVCGKHLAPYLNEMINILRRSIVDPFPDVKRESCRCTVRFAKTVPGWLPWFRINTRLTFLFCAAAVSTGLFFLQVDLKAGVQRERCCQTGCTGYKQKSAEIRLLSCLMVFPCLFKAASQTI